MRRLRLTATFALVSLVAMTGLGGCAGLDDLAPAPAAGADPGRPDRRGVRRRRRSSARSRRTRFRTGTCTPTLVRQPRPRVHAGAELDAGRRPAVDRRRGRRLRQHRPRTDAASADTPGRRQRRIPDPQRFQDAIQRVERRLGRRRRRPRSTPSGRSTQRLDVYVPVMYDRTSPTAVAEVVLSYDETAAAIHREALTILYVTAGGLALLWLLLFRTVHRASRRLRTQASENARLALLDPLTGLPNRRLFNDRLDRAAAVSARSGLPLACCCWTSTGSRTSTTPSATRAATRCWSRWPAGCAARSATPTRSRGSAATSSPSCCRSWSRSLAAETFAQRVREVFDEPFDLEGMLLHVDTSVGPRGAARARRRRDLPDGQGRHRDVHREGGRRRRRDVRRPGRRHRRVEPADAARRPAPGAGQGRRAAPALPAQGRPAHRRGGRARGAAALAAPGARATSRRRTSSRSPSAPGSCSR